MGAAGFALAWGFLLPCLQASVNQSPHLGWECCQTYLCLSLESDKCRVIIEVAELREQQMPSHIYAGTARARGSISATSTAWRSTSASTQWTCWARACQARRPQRRPHLEHAWLRL